jgi:hypothetical protein
MVLEQGSMDTFSKNFEEYLNLGLDINRVNGDIAKITPAAAPPGTQPTTPGTQPQQPPTVQQTPPAVPNTPATPADLTKPPETVPANVNIQPPKPQETPPNIPAVTPKTTPTAAPPATPATTPKPPEAPAEIKTGNALVDMILNFAIKQWPGLRDILAKMGLGGAAKIEFAGLNDNEKQEGIFLKETSKAFDLDLKIMAVLFSDSEQMKRVLKNKYDSNIKDWEIYFKTFVNSEEQQKLKTDKTLKPKEIADILISKVETGQTPSSKPNTIVPPPATQP